MIATCHLKDPRGGGFWVSNDHVLTCAHVLGNDKSATLWHNGTRYEADVIAVDAEIDLPLLKLRGSTQVDVVPLLPATSNDPEMGEDVYTIGFPMAKLLGNQARLTEGQSVHLKASKEMTTNFKFAAIHPEIAAVRYSTKTDSFGELSANAQHTLCPKKKSGGAAPQNVNFALKPEKVSEFLERNLPHYDASDLREPKYRLRQRLRR